MRILTFTIWLMVVESSVAQKTNDSASKSTANQQIVSQIAPPTPTIYATTNTNPSIPQQTQHLQQHHLQLPQQNLPHTQISLPQQHAQNSQLQLAQQHLQLPQYHLQQQQLQLPQHLQQPQLQLPQHHVQQHQLQPPQHLQSQLHQQQYMQPQSAINYATATPIQQFIQPQHTANVGYSQSILARGDPTGVISKMPYPKPNFSLASDVSAFSFSNPVVAYNNHGLLTQFIPQQSESDTKMNYENAFAKPKQTFPSSMQMNYPIYQQNQQSYQPNLTMLPQMTYAQPVQYPSQYQQNYATPQSQNSFPFIHNLDYSQQGQEAMANTAAQTANMVNYIPYPRMASAPQYYFLMPNKFMTGQKM